MTERKSIKVPVEWYEEHKPRKEEADLTWPEYLDGERVATIEHEVPQGVVDYDEIDERMREIVREELRNQLQSLKGGVQ